MTTKNTKLTKADDFPAWEARIRVTAMTQEAEGALTTPRPIVAGALQVAWDKANALCLMII